MRSVSSARAAAPPAAAARAGGRRVRPTSTSWSLSPGGVCWPRVVSTSAQRTWRRASCDRRLQVRAEQPQVGVARGEIAREPRHCGEVAREAPGRRQHAREEDREEDERAGQRDEGQPPPSAGSEDPVLPGPANAAGMQEVDVKARARDCAHPHNPRSASPNAWRNRGPDVPGSSPPARRASTSTALKGSISSSGAGEPEPLGEPAADVGQIERSGDRVAREALAVVLRAIEGQRQPHVLRDALDDVATGGLRARRLGGRQRARVRPPRPRPGRTTSRSWSRKVSAPAER